MTNTTRTTVDPVEEYSLQLYQSQHQGPVSYKSSNLNHAHAALCTHVCTIYSNVYSMSRNVHGSAAPRLLARRASDRRRRKHNRAFSARTTAASTAAIAAATSSGRPPVHVQHPLAETEEVDLRQQPLTLQFFARTGDVVHLILSPRKPVSDPYQKLDAQLLRDAPVGDEFEQPIE